MKLVNKYLGKIDKKMCCVVCLILGFVLGCIYLKAKKTSLEGLKNMDTTNCFVYCYMNGCPHCEAVTPKWDEFVKENNGKYKTIKLIKKENSKHPNFMKKHNISGFPTFIYINNNGKKTQCEERTEKSWKKFLDNLN